MSRRVFADLFQFDFFKLVAAKETIAPGLSIPGQKVAVGGAGRNGALAQGRGQRLHMLYAVFQLLIFGSA